MMIGLGLKVLRDMSNQLCRESPKVVQLTLGEIVSFMGVDMVINL
jgi:hypothetical protein